MREGPERTRTPGRRATRPSHAGGHDPPTALPPPAPPRSVLTCAPSRRQTPEDARRGPLVWRHGQEGPRTEPMWDRPS
jgi:hypothetical protein